MEDSWGECGRFVGKEMRGEWGDFWMKGSGGDMFGESSRESG